jgi:hypothetical protein
MNIQVHIFRSTDVSKENLQRVVEYLSSYPGIMQFIAHDFSVQLGRNEDLQVMSDAVSQKIDRSTKSVFFQPINEKNWASKEGQSFPDFFEACDAFRNQENIPEDEHIFLLTSKRNNLNWFAAPDVKTNKLNYFIQMDEWEFYTQSDKLYPVAYQLATLVLKSYMFRNFAEYEQARHMRPIGCMLDFCQRKKDVSIKMRTADICPACQELILEREVPNLLTVQTLRIMDGIRSAILFKERFGITQQSPGIWISQGGLDIGVNDIGDFSFGLNPLENTLYRFFLNHPEGIQLSYLQDYRDEIYSLYMNFQHTVSEDTIQSRIQELINPNSNSASEKISRIKKKITGILGAEMSQELIIQGQTGEPKKIALDRKKVQIR